MNISKIAQDFSNSLQSEEQVDIKPLLAEREAKVVRIVEALREIQTSGAWSTLKSEIFDGLVDSLERELKLEAKKENPDTLKLARTAGKLLWAEQYADLSKLEKRLLDELKGIKLNQKQHG